MSEQQRHHVLIFQPSFGHARAAQVWADRYEARGDMTVFLRGERAVHLAPTRALKRVESFDDQRAAELRLRALLEARAGAATMHVSEAVPARRRAPKQPIQGGHLAEGVSMRINEAGVARRSHKD